MPANVITGIALRVKSHKTPHSVAIAIWPVCKFQTSSVLTFHKEKHFQFVNCCGITLCCRPIGLDCAVFNVPSNTV